jgi:hypothetical protein
MRYNLTVLNFPQDDGTLKIVAYNRSQSKKAQKAAINDYLTQHGLVARSWERENGHPVAIAERLKQVA